jgi:hypothetical protein
MKKVTVILSISAETNEILQKAHEKKPNALKRAYAEAEEDQDRMKSINDWKALDITDWE